MKNSITVQIAGQEYTLIADQDAQFTQKVAARVDGKIRELMEGVHLSLADSAILACMNVTEEYYKELEGAENLRRQLKEYLEEGTKMKLELSEAKREIFKLENKK